MTFETDALLKQYDAVRQLHDLPCLALCGCKFDTPKEFSSGDEAWKALTEFNPKNGWLLFQSHQTSFEEGLPETEESWGVLLSAEVAINDIDSIRIIFESGQWKLITHHHLDEPTEYLWDEVRHIHHSGKTICYRRYWKMDSDRGYLQTHTALKNTI